MDRRLQLHEELCDLSGSRNVYFQPPETVKMKYPCIVYHLNDSQSIKADNKNYVDHFRYTVTRITQDPSDNFVEEMHSRFQYCSFDRWYASDNLNHFVYDLYY